MALRIPEWLKLLCVVSLLASVPPATIAWLIATYEQDSLNWPPPSGRETGDEKQPNPRNSDQRGDGDQSGTDYRPFVVKIAPSPGAQAETPEQRKERDQKASEDRWSVIFAGIAALATVAVAIVTGLLWWYTYQLWKTTRKAVEGEERAVEAAADAAKAATDQAAKTADLARATGKMAEAAESQLILSSRPHLILEKLSLHGMELTDAQKASLPTVNPVRHPVVKARITNYGKGLGWITEVVAELRVVAATLPVPPGYPPPAALLDSYPIPPDKWLNFERGSATGMDEHVRRQVLDGNANMVLYGRIRYRDALGNIYDDGFCWRCLLPQGFRLKPEFVPGGPAEYWYHT